MKRGTATNRWSAIGGPLLTAFAAAALEILRRRVNLEIPNAASIILLVVVFATFAGGFRPGLVSALLAGLFFLASFSKPGAPLKYEPGDLEKIGVLCSVMLAMVTLVGVLHRRSTEQVALRLRESEERFRAFMDHSPTVAWMKDAEGRYVYVNAPFEMTFNVRRDALAGRSDTRPWPAETEAAMAENDQGVLATGRPRQLYTSLPGPDGKVQHWWILQFPVDDGSGQKFVGGLALDISEQKRAEEALRASEERYALAAKSVNDGLWDWNLQSNEVYYSSRWKSMLGHEDGEIGTSPEEWFRRVHPEDAPQVRAALEAHLAGRTPVFESEHRIRHKDRGYRWVLSRGLAVRNGENRPYRMVGAQTDTTQRKLAEEQLLHDALHDSLTGLPNRSLFLDRLSHRLRQSRRDPRRPFAVLFLDLDRFKLVNDSLGHAAGDELLVQTARRLEAAVRPGDTVARLGGDEFAVLLEDVPDPNDAVHVAERIQVSLQAPLAVGGQQIVSTVSIGIALSVTGYERAEDILRDADTAMYRAKSQGRARHEVFDSAMHARAVALLELETDLRQALEREEFEDHYMPVVSLETGRVTGFEALVRWRHPRRGRVPPGDFISVAEDAGLTIAIDRWMLHRACRQVKAWHGRFPEAAGRLTVSVNLSGRQFRQSDLVEAVEQAIAEAGLEGPSLAVEITENVLIESTDQALQILGRLRRMGVEIYLDDFGTGYSSLSYLQRFPIDVVKIDRSFVARMGPRGEGHEIVRAIVTLAHNLGLRVVAEGIETPDQLAELRTLRCGYGQGALFSLPVSAERAEEILAQDPRW
jgi:diguanylate cyclase (GGDEF)-like protein/PAS domain S-box-containing protein